MPVSALSGWRMAQSWWMRDFFIVIAWPINKQLHNWATRFNELAALCPSQSIQSWALIPVSPGQWPLSQPLTYNTMPRMSCVLSSHSHVVLFLALVNSFWDKPSPSLVSINVLRVATVPWHTIYNISQLLDDDVLVMTKFVVKVDCWLMVMVEDEERTDHSCTRFFHSICSQFYGWAKAFFS